MEIFRTLFWVFGCLLLSVMAFCAMGAIFGWLVEVVFSLTVYAGALWGARIGFGLGCIAWLIGVISIIHEEF